MPKSSPPTAASIKSFVRNNLLASPEFPGLYAAVLASEGHNPKQAKDLAEQYQKKFGVNMSGQSKIKICAHIKVSGVRCGSPALRGEEFCYFHQRMIRTVKSPHSRLHHVALLENEQAIQASLMEVVNALVRGTIDLKRGELILRALNAAVRNSRRAHFNVDTEMITQLPDFESEQEPITSTAGAQYAATLAEREPSVGVKEAAAPKERKIEAHGASRGTVGNQMEQAPQGAKENPTAQGSKSPP